MMLCDGYETRFPPKVFGLRAITTRSRGPKLFLGGDFGAAEAFGRQWLADPILPLGHVGLARP